MSDGYHESTQPLGTWTSLCCPTDTGRFGRPLKTSRLCTWMTEITEILSRTSSSKLQCITLDLEKNVTNNCVDTMAKSL